LRKEVAPQMAVVAVVVVAAEVGAVGAAVGAAEVGAAADVLVQFVVPVVATVVDC
jgi:hypothetical protein